MIPKDLEASIREAAEIAKGVPENLQEAAFNRALDVLLGTTGSGKSAAGSEVKSDGQTNKSALRHPPPEHDLVQILTAKIAATNHPEVQNAQSVLDQALWVLHVARLHDIDGLTPGEISRILSEKFRIASRTASISDALGKATSRLVDRDKEGNGYRYRIMEAGESHLSPLADKDQASGTASAPSKPRRRRSTRAPKSDDESATKNSKSGRASGRPGPKKMLEDLIAQGFFQVPQTMTSIRDHLKSATGRTYTSNDLSPTLLRLLRGKSLQRSKNEDGQYEYRSE